jgi:hypothetical protein
MDWRRLAQDACRTPQGSSRFFEVRSLLRRAVMRPRFAALLILFCTFDACTEVREIPVATDALPTESAAHESDGGDASEPQASDAEPSSQPSAQPYEPPASWQRVTGSCGISLRAPALVPTPSRGIDSCVASFQGPDCSYSADLGGFSDPLTRYDGDAKYTVEMLPVAGKTARLVTSRLRLEDQRFFVAIHVPGPLWAEAPGVTLSIAAFCFSAEGRDTARKVLPTVEIPKSSGMAPPLSPAVSCSGDDIRPITGYRLGKSCVDAKVEVPGICALGARAHASFGSGPMVCFVSQSGDYYWAHVAYGEYVAGPVTRRGWSQTMTSQLTTEEEIRCKALVDMLPDAGTAAVSGERSYAACDAGSDAGS